MLCSVRILQTVYTGGMTMKKTIVTISREFGSGGRTIGHQVADRLGYPYYDKELIKKVAEKTGFDPNYVEEYGEYSPGKSHMRYDANRK